VRFPLSPTFSRSQRGSLQTCVNPTSSLLLDTPAHSYCNPAKRSFKAETRVRIPLGTPRKSMASKPSQIVCGISIVPLSPHRSYIQPPRQASLWVSADYGGVICTCHRKNYTGVPLSALPFPVRLWIPHTLKPLPQTSSSLSLAWRNRSAHSHYNTCCPRRRHGEGPSGHGLRPRLRI
jgi:hypothetical protein